jgi:spore germination protein KB
MNRKMSLEKGKISTSQLFWLITGFVQGSSVILPPGSDAKHEAWIAIFIGLLEGLVMALIYTGLVTRFPGKSMIRIFVEVYGKILGTIVAGLFCWYLFHLGSMVMVNYTSFFPSEIMPETPPLVFGIIITFVCAYAVTHGLEVFSRCAEILTPVTAAFFIGVSILFMKDLKIENFQPVFEIPFIKLLGAAHNAASFPFEEVIAFIMIFPYVHKPNQTFKIASGALIFAGMLLTLASIRTIGILGNTAGIFTYPSYQIGRLINLGEFLNRLEIVTAINFFAMGFFKITVCLYGAVLGVAELFQLKTYRGLVLPLAILMLLLTLNNFASIPENLEFAKIYPIYALPFQVGIPLITLIVALIRGLPKERS